MMISKRETIISPRNDNYGRLARYIADASKGGEKCLTTWTAGCQADDFDLARYEVKATQACNTRSTKEKTYHMIVSFRPEDQERLKPEDFKEIELAFANSLGFENHQRHCGVHINTRNMHMHVAYNMIHPESKARHEPFQDFKKRDQVCREMEKRFGLVVDPGREIKDEKTPTKRTNSRAMKAEAHSGLKSFHTYVLERKKAILEELARATSWQDLHKRLALQGLEIKLRGNGCVISALDAQRKGNHHVKASDVSRELSKGRLEKRFGQFEKSKDGYQVEDRYGLEPKKKLKTTNERRMWALYLREARESNFQLKRSWKQFAFQVGRFLDHGMER